MSIDLDKAHAAFESYVSAYDPTEPKIALKIEHTYRVEDLVGQIATHEGWSEDDVRLARLCGLLHDIGRFEQVRRFGTFSDSQSTSHALLGVEVLFSSQESDAEKRIRTFIDDADSDTLIQDVIRTHSDYRIPDDLDRRCSAFCNVIRDADKIDILRAFCESDPVFVLDVSMSEIDESPLSARVIDAFWSHRTCRRDERSWPADYIVSYACFAFELVFSYSRHIMRQQGKIFDLLSRRFSNPQTDEEFRRMLSHVRDWL